MKEKMSEELECFKRIKNLLVCVDYEKDIVKSVYEIMPNSCDKVEQALITKSKKELAFDIIKEKCVDVGYVITLFMYQDYNSKMDELWGDKAPSYYLTEEEFKLLKEVLCSE